MAQSGLPKKYAKMGFKKGWAEYRKVHGKTKKKSNKKPKAQSGSKKRSAPKKKKSSNNNNKSTKGGNRMANKTRPRLLASAGAAGTVISGLRGTITDYKAGLITQEQAMARAVRNFTGYNYLTGEFQGGEMLKTYAPVMIGLAGSIVASKTGANKYIPRWLPFIL